MVREAISMRFIGKVIVAAAMLISSTGWSGDGDTFDPKAKVSKKLTQWTREACIEVITRWPTRPSNRPGCREYDSFVTHCPANVICNVFTFNLGGAVDQALDCARRAGLCALGQGSRDECLENLKNIFLRCSDSMIPEPNNPHIEDFPPNVFAPCHLSNGEKLRYCNEVVNGYTFKCGCTILGCLRCSCSRPARNEPESSKCGAAVEACMMKSSTMCNGIDCTPSNQPGPLAPSDPRKPAIRCVDIIP